MGRIVTEVVTRALLSAKAEVDYNEIAGDIPKVVAEVTTFGLLDAAPLPDWMVNRLRGLGRSAEEARLRLAAEKLTCLRPASLNEAHHLPSLLRASGAAQDNTLGFMLAGFETTALGAAWAIYLLARYPEWQDQVRAEVANRTEPAELPITRQVVMETLRLYPPAPILVRKAIQHTELRGDRLAPGQAILIPVYAIHRHQQLWQDPNDFDPNRWSTMGSYDRAAYLPFGAGPRLCIAAHFAITEITNIVAELLRTFRFSPHQTEPDVSLRVSTHSLNGIHVKADAL
jgi:cytochrome P450